MDQRIYTQNEVDEIVKTEIKRKKTENERFNHKIMSGLTNIWSVAVGGFVNFPYSLSNEFVPLGNILIPLIPITGALIGLIDPDTDNKGIKDKSIGALEETAKKLSYAAIFPTISKVVEIYNTEVMPSVYDLYSKSQNYLDFLIDKIS